MHLEMHKYREVCCRTEGLTIRFTRDYAIAEVPTGRVKTPEKNNRTGIYDDART